MVPLSFRVIKNHLFPRFFLVFWYIEIFRYDFSVLSNFPHLNVRQTCKEFRTLPKFVQHVRESLKKIREIAIMSYKNEMYSSVGYHLNSAYSIGKHLLDQNCQNIKDIFENLEEVILYIRDFIEESQTENCFDNSTILQISEIGLNDPLDLRKWRIFNNLKKP